VTLGLVGFAVAPGASADLPAKTPQEVLTLAGESDLESFSGTVEVRTDLGIPTALLTGDDPSAPMDDDRTVRVWRDGDDLARASMASLMGESTVILNGDVLWAYDSDTATVTTTTVPDKPETSSAPWTDEVPDPAEAAQWLLDAVEPTTTVTAGEPTVIAGREAYEVVLTPDQQGTLVGSASMAVDAQTGAVLRVQVTAKGATSPALDIAYTDFDPTPPPADVFALQTPPGATVTERDLPEAYDADESKPEPEAKPTVVGEGWTSVLVLPEAAMTDGGETESDGLSGEMLPADVLTPVDGGSVLSTALVSVMLADDGRVLVGAVEPQLLVAAAR
jgi:outer membrane lipoprotein-sorting protein